MYQAYRQPSAGSEYNPSSQSTGSWLLGAAEISKIFVSIIFDEPLAKRYEAISERRGTPVRLLGLVLRHNHP